MSFTHNYLHTPKELFFLTSALHLCFLKLKLMGVRSLQERGGSNFVNIGDLTFYNGGGGGGGGAVGNLNEPIHPSHARILY